MKTPCSPRPYSFLKCSIYRLLHFLHLSHFKEIKRQLQAKLTVILSSAFSAEVPLSCVEHLHEISTCVFALPLHMYVYTSNQQ